MRNNTLRIFILASLLLFGALYFYSGQVEDHYRDNATKFLRVALSDISSWEIEPLRSRLSRDTVDAVSNESLRKLLDHYRHLGAFQSMEEPVFSRVSGALSVFADKPRLGYSSRVQFEHGSAIMTATLTVEDQHFRFYNLSFGESQANQE